MAHGYTLPNPTKSKVSSILFVAVLFLHDDNTNTHNKSRAIFCIILYYLLMSGKINNLFLHLSIIAYICGLGFLRHMQAKRNLFFLFACVLNKY